MGRRRLTFMKLIPNDSPIALIAQRHWLAARQRCWVNITKSPIPGDNGIVLGVFVHCPYMLHGSEKKRILGRFSGLNALCIFKSKMNRNLVSGNLIGLITLAAKLATRQMMSPFSINQVLARSALPVGMLNPCSTVFVPITCLDQLDAPPTRPW